MEKKGLVKRPNGLCNEHLYHVKYIRLLDERNDYTWPDVLYLSLMIPPDARKTINLSLPRHKRAFLTLESFPSLAPYNFASNGLQLLRLETLITDSD